MNIEGFLVLFIPIICNLSVAQQANGDNNHMQGQPIEQIPSMRLTNEQRPQYSREIGQQNSTWYQGQRRETVPSSQQTRQNTVAQLLGISDSGPTARRKIHTAKRAITAPVHSESDLLLNDVQADRISKTADKRSTLPSPMEIIGNVENWLNSGGIKQKILQIISEVCRLKGATWCKEQRPETNLRLQQTKQSLKSTLTQLQGISDFVAGLIADRRLQKIHTAKRALMKTLGLENIEPAEDGLWEGDLILNEQQADRIIKTAGKFAALPSPMDVIGKLGFLKNLTNLRLGRRKRNGMMFDETPDYKWPGGQVPYYISPDFTDAQKQMIKDDLQMIQARTCIQFQEVSVPYSSPYIYYRPTTLDGICGQSPLGMQSDVNAIDLNFDSSSPDWMRKCIQHETLHSLGVAHTQSRYDRDDYVELQTNNINPQNYYNFVKVDPSQYSSFGVAYEAQSMMHYGSYSFSINGQPTIVPKASTNLITDDLGNNREISEFDALLLNRMYSCVPCKDDFWQCGYWANYGFCSSAKNSCQKSCGTCQ